MEVDLSKVSWLLVNEAGAKQCSGTDEPVHMGQTALYPSQNGICRAASAVDHDRYNAVISGMLRRLHGCAILVA